MTDAAHPLLPSATPLLRDGAGAIQVGGVDSGAGLLIGPGGAGPAALLRGLDGRRTQRAVLRDADRDGLDRTTVVHVLDGLRAAGLLLDVDAADLLAADAGPAAAAHRGRAPDRTHGGPDRCGGHAGPPPSSSTGRTGSASRSRRRWRPAVWAGSGCATRAR